MGMDSKERWVNGLAALGAGAVVLYGSKVLIDLFGPQPKYAMKDLRVALDSEEFIQFLSVVTDGSLRRSRLKRLKDGREFYPAYLEAIGRAEKAINLEFYEFLEGRVSGELLEVLTERARAGVEVRVLVDAVGSFATGDRYFDRLRSAGGQMKWYHPVGWDTWPNLNQRTHRKLLIIDGHTGFMGGAGVADHWLYGTEKEPVWRDTVFCVEGEAVAGMISTFSENWLEAAGEILSGPKQFGFKEMPEGAESFVVSSTPRGGGTQARILFQALINERAEIDPDYDAIFSAGPGGAPGVGGGGGGARGGGPDIDGGAEDRPPDDSGAEPAECSAHGAGRGGGVGVPAGDDPRKADDGGWDVERGGVDELRSPVVCAERRGESGGAGPGVGGRDRGGLCGRLEGEPAADGGGCADGGGGS